jgi:hypothetical protein
MAQNITKYLQTVLQRTAQTVAHVLPQNLTVAQAVATWSMINYMIWQQHQQLWIVFHTTQLGSMLLTTVPNASSCRNHQLVSGSRCMPAVTADATGAAAAAAQVAAHVQCWTQTTARYTGSV